MLPNLPKDEVRELGPSGWMSRDPWYQARRRKHLLLYLVVIGAKLLDQGLGCHCRGTWAASSGGLSTYYVHCYM